MPLKENDRAPAFTAKDQNGQPHSLADFRGKWILLYFYPKDDTPGCKREACGFRDQYSELKQKLTILGVSHDTPETHLKFAKKYQLPFTLLSDPQKKIIKSYQAAGFLFTKRISYLIDPEGLITKVYEKVSPASHASEILSDLETILTERKSSSKKSKK